LYFVQLANNFCFKYENILKPITNVMKNKSYTITILSWKFFNGTANCKPITKQPCEMLQKEMFLVGEIIKRELTRGTELHKFFQLFFSTFHSILLHCPPLRSIPIVRFSHQPEKTIFNWRKIVTCGKI